MDGGVKTCGLCHLFYYHECEECPIMQHTGKVECQDTPYGNYHYGLGFALMDAIKEKQFLTEVYNAWSITHQEERVIRITIECPPEIESLLKETEIRLKIEKQREADSTTFTFREIGSLE